MMTTNTYLETINKRYKAGNATEHTFRGDLQQLLESLVPSIIATNEPKRIRCGAPDYIITSKKNIPIGYIEAKDIGVSLEKTDKTDQLTRYKGSLDNLILTDYCDFWFYKNGVFTTKIQIAKVEGKEIKPLPENIATFENLIQSFCTQVTQSIKSAPKLAEMMANKARMIQQVIELALKSDEENYENTSLQDQYEAFKEILIHDLTQEQFADVYAQTIAYGMFAARFHDPTLETFSRQEASELLPKSNPFLRKLFQHIAGYDVDERITWILDDLVDIFKASDVKAILQTWGSNTGQQDAIVHFYETFLSLYNPALRKSRGVWYTPEAVVNFMVRAVDDILKDEFGLANGLADTSKTKITVRNEQAKKKQEEIEVHKVQILDPATGTGTFLAEPLQLSF